MSEVKSLIDNAIAGNKVFVVSKSYCPYCVKAKSALAKFNIPEQHFEWMDIEKHNDMAAIQDYMQVLTGGRSVPRVFINGKFFGGGDDTAAAAKNGKLEKVLAEAGAI
uniref:Glutaredoxin domain-containing protein n=1 Tax=Rhabditophanes sp. KR3021 TaxID=114890 RepID=A0AC35U052_9BILA